MSSLEQQLTDLVAEGRISSEDADTVLEFREFLREMGPRNQAIKPAVLLKYADLIGFTEEERQQLRDKIPQCYCGGPEEAVYGHLHGQGPHCGRSHR